VRAYLDNLATTPLDPAVADAMNEVYRDAPGNPHARFHPFGRNAFETLERARAEVAQAIGASAEAVVFVPSATAANNLAVLGVASRRRKHGRHVLVSAIEHASVLEPARELRRMGFEVEEVPVGAEGVVEPEAVRERLRADTILVSVMAVNNEIGTIQPIEALSEVVRSHGAVLHCDAAQAPGKIRLDGVVRADLVTLSSHKVHGPAGIAALVVRKPEHAPRPLLYGGGQERGAWPGTVPVALAVGFAKALRLAVERLDEDRARIGRLESRLRAGIEMAWPGSHRNPRSGPVVPHCLSVTFRGVQGETVLGRLASAQVAAAFGSACSSEASAPSHVLRAIGLSAEEARRTLRFGFGRFTTGEEVQYTLEVLGGLAAELASRRLV